MDLSVRKFGMLEIVRWTHRSGSYVECIPALGSCLFQLCLKQDQKTVVIFPEFSDSQTFLDFYRSKFAGAMLFPYPNRVNQGIYTFEGVQHNLHEASFSGEHAIHGLIFDQQFSMDNGQKKDSLQTEFSFDESQFPGFPFAFQLVNNFKLTSDCLEIETRVTNRSKNKAPFGMGWHPYFDLNKSSNEVKLKLPNVKNLWLKANQIPSGTYELFEQFSKPEIIGLYPFDNCFKLDRNEELACTELHMEDYIIALEQYTGNSGYNFVQIYHYTDKAWIAIEPMSCAPDALNNKLGLHILNPNEQRSYLMRIKLN